MMRWYIYGLYVWDTVECRKTERLQSRHSTDSIFAIYAIITTLHSACPGYQVMEKTGRFIFLTSTRYGKSPVCKGTETFTPTDEADCISQQTREDSRQVLSGLLFLRRLDLPLCRLSLDDLTLAAAFGFPADQSDKFIVDIHLLRFDAVRSDYFFMHHDLLNQLVKNIRR